MDYTWSDQMNWLPVMGDFDLLDDFMGPTSAPFLGAGDQLIPSVSDSRSPIGSSSTISASLTDSAVLKSRPVDSTYVDGDGARRSVQEGHRHASNLYAVEPAILPILDLGFPMSSQIADGITYFQHPNTSSLNATTYNTISKQFTVLCCRQPSLFATQMTSAIFPSHPYCSFCLTMFQVSPPENLPLVHSTAWQEQDDHWILVLAAITVGARHDNTQDGHQCRIAFEEFLRRAIRNASENGADCDPLPFAQACILSVITYFNTSGTRSSGLALAEAHVACELYARQYRPQSLKDIDPSQLDLQWRAWIAQESHCRLLWCQWLVQTYTHLLRVEDGSISLPLEDHDMPSSEARWEASSAVEWMALGAPDQSMLATPAPQRTGGVRSLLHTLYTKNKLPERISITSKIFMIYCLLAKTAEVARAVRDPLSSWSPGPLAETEQSESGSEDDRSHQQSQQWLPANSIYASWRNSACDCLDAIHWTANGDVALEKGYEKPIIFHLHLSRILLLCPYRALIATGRQLSTARAQSSQGFPAADLDTSVLQSLTLDDHKVRLSLVHAGAIFWHCRRYSRGMFYEPFGIFVSALLIVVYGIYLPQIRQALVKIKLSVLQNRGGEQPASSDSEDELLPDDILLDRPCDDEMVQIFVRKGHEMNVKMSKAGDICVPLGQRIVLEEAIKLLGRSQYVHLADCQEYARTLRQLMQKL
ncbi:unnamed protein product [Zymoseptoria tritici ST99CH_1E4]|uniref:Transcription factor domain-containing protein n=1 Tax=Zymoseptoria tritici ST99CH_1E4 TaxID=1276532 RepID=A0A2H1FP47_ZYMTR|nr:unnamed protein product [Zymoseptoria tritici ST99CH_1E4]